MKDDACLPIAKLKSKNGFRPAAGCLRRSRPPPSPFIPGDKFRIPIASPTIYSSSPTKLKLLLCLLRETRD
ncbi:unnamed protein product [Arabidopsis lyrata]|nr:unnamed protein product [Arabidopsis lyrata]